MKHSENIQFDGVTNTNLFSCWRTICFWLPMNQRTCFQLLGHSSWSLVPCGVHSVTTKGNFVEILRFKFFHDYFTFEEDDQNNKRKVLKKHFNVSVVVDLVSGDTRK